MYESHIPLSYRPNFFINMSDFIYVKTFYEYVKKYSRRAFYSKHPV